MADFIVRRWDLDPHPGDQAPPHVHFAGDEAFCVIRGQLEVLLGTERRRLDEGDFLVVPAGTTHTFATVGTATVTILAVMTPEIGELIEALHSVEPVQDRADVWARYNSAVVDPHD